jgi:hypothetical protein
MCIEIHRRDSHNSIIGNVIVIYRGIMKHLYSLSICISTTVVDLHLLAGADTCRLG